MKLKTIEKINETKRSNKQTSLKRSIKMTNLWQTDKSEKLEKHKLS